MINIGLTGNLCSGYESVGEIFKLYHVPVFDADIALKFLLNYREDIMRDIKIQFGTNIYNKGLIDQSKFNTTEKFDKLVDIAQPELLNLYNTWKTTQKSNCVVFKSGILFERGLNEKMNYNVSVFRPRDERAYKLFETGVSLLVSYEIIDSEMDELTKNQKADWTIHNYDNLSLLTQTKVIHDNIESRSIKNVLNKVDDYNTLQNILS
jgi:dephospho-CoA kinase